MKNNKMRLISILVCALTAWGNSPSWAASYFWTNNVGGDFTNANWNLVGFPGATDIANFTNNAGYQVDWTTSVTNSIANFNGGTVTQNIGLSTWFVTNGASSSAPGYVLGLSAGQTGNVVQTSGKLVSTNAGSYNFVVGRSGVGSFTENGGAVLVNEVRIGDASSGNNVTVAGGGTLWSNTGIMYLGNVGSGNVFLVTNSATVYSKLISYVGYASGGNIVTVTGSGSLWTNAAGVTIGNSTGQGNQLQILDGGVVVDTVGVVGSGATSSNNMVTVSGAGSIWRNTTDLRVGDVGGTGNQLIVTNQGTVISAGNVYIGNVGKNGSAIVTGAGSVLSNGSSALYVGYASGGNGNQLQVLDNGTVYAGLLDIGGNTSGGGAAADSNSVVISGGGAIRVAAAGDARVGSGGGSYNSLLITNSGLLVDSTGRFGDGGGNNSATVTDSGSVWSNTGVIHMGVSGSGGNTLVVTNNGLMYVGGASFNLGYGTANNTVTITDNGVLTNLGTLYVGLNAGGAGNQLNVARTGLVYSVTGLTLGNTALASNNTVTVSTGGRLTAGATIIGNVGSNNTITVTDLGSVLSNTSVLYLGVGGASAGNSLLITNRGVVYTGSSGSWVGYQSSSNTVTVTGDGSIWTNTGTITLGGRSPSNLTNSGNQISIVSSGLVVSAGVTIGEAGAGTGESDFNTMTVSDTGSVLRVTGAITVGNVGRGNQMIVSNGATVYALGSPTGLQIGGGAIATNNSVIIAGNGTVWTNPGSLYVGNGGGYNRLTVQDGAVMYGSAAIGGNGVNTTGSNNTLVVSGGTVFGNVTPGSSSANNNLIITNGGKVWKTGAANVAVGSAATSSGNSVLVAGAGSVWSNGTFTLGVSGSGNSMVISNGGTLVTADTYLGRNTGSDNNSALVTGPGSLWSGNGFTLGSNGANHGIGTTLRVENGGTLETTSSGFVAGLLGSGTISNYGGVYQFTSATPVVTPGTVGAISISNGWISFRGISDADVKSDWTGNLTNIAYSGNNKFRLNSSSNTTVNQNYTFNTGLGGTNYVGLELVNGNSLWRSANLTIGSGGTFLASNTIGTVAALVTNIGNIEVNYSQMTWSSNVVISGRYKSDPSTNIFLADVTVSQSGTLVGGVGDLFDFKKSLIINSTNQIGFQLGTSAVRFSGGGMHTNAVTGADLGSNVNAYASAFELQTNFAYGELHLGSVTDQVCFACGVLPSPAVTNIGLYVGWLDLLGNFNLVTNLHAASGINIYYSASDTRNGYLNNLSYQLTDCNFVSGGGWLIPIIPEPSALAFFSVAALLAMRWKRR